jgi:hypothetical protein
MRSHRGLGRDIGAVGIVLASACSLAVDTNGLTGGADADGGPNLAAPEGGSPPPRHFDAAGGANSEDASDEVAPRDDANGASAEDASDASESEDAPAVNPGPDADADAGGPPALALVNAISKNYVNATTLSASLTVSSGDLLVLGAYWDYGSATATVSVSDTLGNSWVSAPAQSEGSCASQVQIWYSLGVKAGANTVTVNKTSANIPALGLFLLEYAGVGAGAAFDSQAGQGATGSSNLLTTGSLTTTGSLDLVVALFSDGNDTGALGAGMGFASEGADVGYDAIIEDNLPAGVAAGSLNPAATLPHGNSDHCWVGTAAAFKVRE